MAGGPPPAGAGRDWAACAMQRLARHNAPHGPPTPTLVKPCRASGHAGELSSRGGIGFLADVRRQNVGLTRAKRALWVLGNAATLRVGPSWAALLDHCRAEEVLARAEPPYDRILRRRSTH